MTTSPFQQRITTALDAVRQQRPLVHNITNKVVMNFTANGLLALGASPVMADAIEETADMVDLANALVINIGTPSARTGMVMKCAVSHAHNTGKPWVLDPVGAAATRFHLDTARLMLEYRPNVVRANASEIQALYTGELGGKGVDSTETPEAVESLAMTAARDWQTTIAITGATDLITDGYKQVRLHNGHPMMARVTGTDCLATALTGAFLAVEGDGLTAVTTALAVLGIAGERAAAEVAGPGSLHGKLLNELYLLTPDILNQHLKLEEQ
ncbi:MAG: hydroxyethylthiazole kinase [Oceanospirillales bacterium LUC14_002_19_P2]|nr:MAG: hydroxyethylthiazole kinase [Oceanospirillales bacterium LUC14_002_19_P2]